MPKHSRSKTAMMLTLLDDMSITPMRWSSTSIDEESASLWPGCLIVFAIALVATGIAEILTNAPAPLGPVPISAMLVAIIAGLVLGQPIRRRARLKPGIDAAKSWILKASVVLVGLRLSLADLLSTGTQAIPLVVAMIVTGLFVVLMLGRLFKVSPRLTILLAAGTSICGASAIAAISPALKAHHEETCYAVASIGILGLIAIIVYPLILQQTLIDPTLIGLALGTVIHDTAQVTAAAVYHQQLWPNEHTLDAATVAKLLRNSTMLIVIPALVVLYHKLDARSTEDATHRIPFPLFIVGFVALSMVRTAGDTWLLGEATRLWSGGLALANQLSLLGFAMAMAALASTVSVAELRSLGIRGFLAAALATWTMLLITLIWLAP